MVQEDTGWVDPDLSQPRLFAPYDPGYIRYPDGSYDHIKVSTRNDTYVIDRYNADGERIGGESGRLSGYVGSGPPAPWMAPAPPAPWMAPAPLGLTQWCYTSAGAILVTAVMRVGERCVAYTPYGTFFGMAGR